MKCPRLISSVAHILAILTLGNSVRAEPAGKAAVPDSVPVVIRQDPPEYPFSLRLSGNKGRVVVEFIVDTSGNVVQAGVTESSHPDFEAPAVEAVLGWKFRPGIRNGHPVYTRMEVPVIFFLNPRPSGFPGRPDNDGVDVWSIPGPPAKGTPPQFAYDVPPQPLVTSAPVYPYNLLVGKVKGEATVTFAVDPAGRTQLLRLEGSSSPDFGAAAVAMIEAWSFRPATQHGKPCWALLRKKQVFERDNDDFPISDSARRLLRELKRDPCPILADGRKLDMPLRGRFQPGPAVPLSVRQSNSPADAVVEFIVDHAGHAQLPRVISASNPDFGWAAATAVARWQFTQPIFQGHPVDVRARVPIAFRPQKEAGPGS